MHCYYVHLTPFYQKMTEISITTLKICYRELYFSKQKIQLIIENNYQKTLIIRTMLLK